MILGWLGWLACSPGPTVWTSVAVGNGTVCGVTDTAKAYCWGWLAGDDEVVALASEEDSISGVDLGGNTLYNEEAHDQACAWTDAGDVVCSDGSRASGFASVSVGDQWLCGKDVNSRLRCTDNPIGFEGAGAEPIRALSADTTAMCAVMSGGPRCWGLEHYAEHISPNAVQLAVGSAGPCWLGEDGDAGCWSAGMADVAPFEGPFEQIVHGVLHACVLDASGRANCWGETATTIWETEVLGDVHYGQLEVPDERFLMLSAQLDTTCGVTLDGRIVCWGRMEAGEDRVPDDPERSARYTIP